MDISNVKFFILAGGYGKRARPLSLVVPKPALPLHGTPLINILLENLRQSGLTRGFVNLFYKPEILRQTIGSPHGLELAYLYEEELSGSKIIAQAANNMDEFLFIMNGDVYWQLNGDIVRHMLQETIAASADGCLLLRTNTNPAYSAIKVANGFFQGVEQHPAAGGPACEKKNSVGNTTFDGASTPFSGKPTASGQYPPPCDGTSSPCNGPSPPCNGPSPPCDGASTLCNGDITSYDGAPMYTGIALLRRKVVESIRHASFFSTLKESNFNIKTSMYQGDWWDLGNPEMYFRANSLYRSRTKSHHGHNSFSENVSLSSASKVQNCILWKNTVISGESFLKDCIVTGDLELHNVKYTRKIIYAANSGHRVESLAV
ncbi:MAG: NTP transferase domain-containing protein [bacterium]|nr:NTP transferase domain-containing protein [bacterium]